MNFGNVLILMIVVLLLGFGDLNAQPGLQWSQTFGGDGGFSVIQTDDG